MRIIKKTTGRVRWNLRAMKVGDVVLVKDESRFATARTIASYYGTAGRRYTATTKTNGLHIKRVS